MAENANVSNDAFEPLGKEEHLDNEKIAAPSLTFTQDAWRRLKKNKVAFVSMWILVVIFALSLAGPLISPHQPNNAQPAYTNLPPKIPGVHIPGLDGTKAVDGGRVNAYAQQHVPSNKYWILGTDYLGRDLLSRIIAGTRVSLAVALIATLLDLTVGVGYGLISGWRGGRTDMIMQRIIEILSSVPNLVYMILLLVVMKGSLLSISLAIGIAGWTTMARLIRAEALTLKSQEYILSARTLGESSWKIAWKHLIPNMSSVIIIQTMFTIPSAIFFEAFLSYIGIGISSPQASLGTLISDGQKNFQFLPYQMWYPAIVLIILMLAFNLLGDGMRDAFDPKSKR
ncbi:MAG TPA: ABC transporter permease [Lactobacillus sp.]|nr:ABC transporter permease [Lactobacillus sp.]